jgi:hypothetical protein
MITCSINNPKIVSLLYSHITAQFKISSKEGVFNYENYLKSLYKKFAETTSPEVAAKYLQSVPRLIIDVANTNLSFMNIDVDLTSLRKLSVQYMSDNAINTIIDTLSDKKINLKNIIDRIKSNELEEDDDENEIPKPSSKSKRLLTASPLSGTLQTLKSQDPNKKLIIEEDDPGRAHIVKALENISASQSMEEDLYTVMYQGKKLMFKPFVLNDFFTKNENLLDPTTIAEVKDSRYLSTKGLSKKNVVQANEKIILVITDENGKFLYFDKDGNLAETGKIVYQFMRNASIENNKIVVKDFYGKAITIQSAETIFKNTYDPEINGSTAKDKALFIKEIKDTLKKESEQLLDLQNRIIKNKEDFLLPITNISTGITEDKISDTYKLNALIDSKLLNKDSLKTIDASSKKATISFKNEKVEIDRMKMSDQLVLKITKVLTNKNLKNKVKLNFVKQFLFLDSKGKRNFSIKEDGPNLIFNILDKNSQEIVEELNLSEVTEDNIENYETKIKDTFFNQIPFLFYNNEIIKGNHVYNDYNTETKEIVQADYLDLIISLNPDIKFINLSNDIFNFVVNFSAEDVSFDNLKESVESELSYESFLKQARKAITEGFVTNSQGYSLNQSLSFVMFNFIKSALDNGEFSTQEQFTKIITDWTENSIFQGSPEAITDKQKNLIRDKFNALPKEKIEAKEVKEITSETDVIQNTIVPGAASPTDTDTDTGIDINDDIFKGLDRKGFKKEKITQEQLEDINTWWNSKALEPLRKVISFKQVFNLVNSDVYATFIVNASKIANPDGSLATISVNRKQGDIFQNLTLYHEAWHIFSQLFLTPQDKIKLYTELRNYTDSKGNKPNITKSYLELEEMLAEDFRNYAKNQKPNPETPVKNTLFRKMLNFLKALFGKLNVFSKKDILVDSMNSPMAKDLFNKLYIGEINSYKPLIENAVLFELDRGIRKVNNPSIDILSNQDSLEVTMTIDNIWAELLSDIYNKRKAAGKQNLKAANVLFLKGIEQKEYLYRETKKILEDKLKKEQEKFNKIEGVASFNEFKTIEEIKSNAAYILKSKDGDDKYIFLKYQISDFNNLTSANKKGDRIKGDFYFNIKVVSDFYTHNIIKKNKKPVGIIVVDRLDDAVEQFNNYVNGGAQVYTELIPNSISEIVLSPEQSVILDNIKILQTTLNNWENKSSGVIKYHSENSDFKTSKKVYDIAVDAKEEIEKEEGVDELTIDAVPGKISLQDMLSKETIYVIKSLFKVVKNKNGDISTPVDRFGFKERADFSDIFNMLYGIIGNISNRDEAYKKLEKEYKKYPELKQFFEEKYPEPNTTNTFEYDLSVSFFNDFGKPNVKYVQLVASRDETVNFQVIELSMETSSIIEKWVSEFNSLSIYNDFIDVIANVPRLNLDKVVSEFKQVKENELDINKQLEFANAIGIGLANNNNIKDELKNNSRPYGLKYIFRILSAFNNVDKLPQQTALQKKYIKEFRENPIKILKEEIPKNILPEIDKVNVIKQNTQIKNLAKLQSQYGFDSSTNAVIRADGNVAYETMNASSVTNNLYAINSVSKQDELWNGKNPILNHMNFLDPKINAFTKNLVMFQSLFGIDKIKIKGKSLNLIVIDGTSEMDGSGTITTKLDPFSKFIQDINMMLLNGKAELGRTADKKMSFGLTVKGGLLKPTLSDGTKGTDDNIFVDPIMFTSQENTGEMYAIEGYLLKYIESEFDRIKKFKGPDREELLKISGFNQIVKKVKGKNVYAGEVFAAFDNLLSDKTKNKLYELAVKEDTISTLLELLKQKDNADLKNNIKNEIKKYFNDKVSKLKKYYYNPIKEKNIFSKGIYKKLGMEVNNQADLNMLNGNEELSDVLLKAFLYNDWIYKFETSTLLFGDIAQWDHTKEDWTKRIPGGTSDGIRFLFDEGTINFINNNFNKPTETNATYASELNKSLGKDTIDYNKYVFSEVINAGVIKDATRKSIYIDDLVEGWREDYLKTFSEAETEERIKEDKEAYEKIVESDGMAFMTIDAYRILHKVSGRGWSMEQESLYQKIVKGETIVPNTVKQFFPIYKLHLFGSIKNKYLPAIAMHKFAVSPLIPGVNAKEGSELYKLHLKMLKDNVQYVTFKSGSKGSELTSNRETDDIFEDKVENTGISDDFTFTINPVYLANLKEVTVINDTFKGSLPIATQTRVILTDTLYNNGELINPKNKKTLDTYTKIVNDYSALLKLKLLNEIGFTEKNGKYVSNGNFSKFIEIIRDNLDERDVPDHLIRLLNTTKEGDDISMDFSLHPEAQTIEKLIMSIVQSRLIKQTINGESLTQAASTFTNGLWNTQYDKITKISEIKKVLGTNTLPSYIRNKNGRTGLMKVAIALQGDFKNLLNANDLQGNKIGTITRLNELIKDDAWLEKNRLSISLYGPRIPNDALSTIEGAEVWHFLDESYGNAIIVPTEIVAKSGSDYDGDKLFMSMPNIDAEGNYINTSIKNFNKILKETKDKEFAGTLELGALTSNKLIKQQEKYLQNQYIKISLDILTLPENFAILTKPNLTYLVEKYSKALENNIKNEYNRLDNVSYTDNEVGERNKSKDGKEVISPSRPYDYIYNLYKFAANLSLEPSLGIQAKNTKNHVLFKMLGAKMPESYKNSVFNKNLREFEDGLIDIPFVIRFKHNIIKLKNGKEVISISGDKSQKGNRITDLNSHMLNGILDRAKNSFPFVLQLTPEGIGVISYLMQAGVDEEEVFYFVTQPLIREYFFKQRLENSSLNPLISTDVKFEKSNKYNIASEISNKILNTLAPNELQKIINSVTLLKLRDTINSLEKIDSANVEYLIKDNEKQSYYYSLNELKKALNNKKINPLNIVSIKNNNNEDVYDIVKSLENKNIDNKTKTYDFSNNYVYLSEVLSRELFKDGITISDLEESINNDISLKSLALFLNFIELEKQYEGLETLQMIYAPDTSKLTTLQQVIKRIELFDKLKRNSKIDQEFLTKLMEDSLLSSFNQDALMIDLIKPLFKLRLDKSISSFISEKLLKERARIARKFGKGVKGEEYFTSSYNNAVVDYIYQNYMSNFTDPVNGKHITIPKALSSKDVIIDNTIEQDVVIGKNIIVNEEKLKLDFDNKIFLNDDALDKFEKNKNPFQTFSSYVRYVMEREVLRESLNDVEVTEEYLSEIALLKSFNSPYIMGKTKYSYSESIMNIINNFDDTKVNFPVLNHIVLKSNKRNINKVLTLNNKSLLTKEISSIYNKNLKDLADPTINKDKKSLEFFKPFSLILFYQHGFGNSKLSINRVLDAKKFTDEMIDASTFFINDLISKDFSSVTLNNIFSKVIDVKNRQFIEYTENADQYNNPVKKNINDGIEIEFDFNGDVLNPVKPPVSGDRPVFDSLPSKSTTSTMLYAGIGSRETPQEVLDVMPEVAKYLESLGYTLRSGKAPGADAAFEKGVKSKKEIFPGNVKTGERELKIAEEIHPAWNVMLDSTRKKAIAKGNDPERSAAFVANLMARNTNQIFGANLDTPVDFVIFYAKETSDPLRPAGGTGQAVEMARRKGIPTINMADTNWREQLKAALATQPTQSSTSVNPFKTSQIQQKVYHVDKRKGLTEETLVDDGTMVFSSGVFFTTEKEYAENYAKAIGGEIYEAYVDVQKPLIVSDKQTIERLGRKPDEIPTGNDSVTHNSNNVKADKYGKVGTEIVVYKPQQIRLILTTTQLSTSAPIREELEGLTEARKVYESLFIATGKLPITFTVGVSTWKLNKNFNYDLIDQDTGEVLLKNVNMVTGMIEEDVVEYTILTRKQLNDYIKDFEQKVIAYNLDELLAMFGINIKDVYKKLNQATTTEDLIEIETEINRKLCQ